MRFTVRAMGQDGVISLAVDAADEAAAREVVRARRLHPLSVAPRRNALPGRRYVFPLALFSQELLALLEAGLTLSEAIEALCDNAARDAARAVLERLLRDLREGLSFSAALDRQPEHFPVLYVGLMRAAEHTSSLPAALTRYLDYRGQLDAVRARLVSALIYPAILLTVGGAVTAFLLGHVVPRFSGIYQGTGRELPWLSQQLMGWGNFAAAHGRWLAVCALVGVVALILGVRTWWRSGGMQRFARRLPGIGSTLALIERSRLYLALGTLLEGGLAILPALRLTTDLLAPEMRPRHRLAASAIERGESVSQAFAAAGLATPVALRLLRVGEQSGRLGEMLCRAARFHDGEIARRIDTFARGFEPLLMAAIGLVVGTIVVLLYLPIFDLAGSLG